MCIYVYIGVGVFWKLMGALANMMIKLRGGTVAFQIEVGYIVHEKEWVGGESIKE